MGLEGLGERKHIFQDPFNGRTEITEVGNFKLGKLDGFGVRQVKAPHAIMPVHIVERGIFSAGHRQEQEDYCSL